MSTETIVGGYRLVNLMMTGQTSQVWEAVEPGSHRRFALKLLLPEHTKSSEHQRFLAHEAAVGMQLTHPNIIKILKFVKLKDNPYIIMEFFPSSNLKLRLMRKHEIIREKAHRIIEQAASALAAMHSKGWVHRDVKPDNILVNSAGEVRLIDFALAARIRKGGGGLFGWLFSGRRRGKTMGTRSYMSPEQIRGQALDARADIYSFGATLYEMVTGRPPFRAPTPNDLLAKHLSEKVIPPRQHNPQITDEFNDLIFQMLAKKRDDRPADMFEFMARFRGIRVFQGDKLERPDE